MDNSDNIKVSSSMRYAFISYSSKNQQMADSFRMLFNQNGIRTWMAPGDIPFGGYGKPPSQLRRVSASAGRHRQAVRREAGA